jgi:hypothetical protein
MRVQVAYTREGRLLGGTVVRQDARAHCRILPASEHLVAEFEIPAAHAMLNPDDLWPRVRIDVSAAEHRLIIADSD